MISLRRISQSQMETGRKRLLDGCRIPFIFKSGGDGQGMGYRVNGAVVARAYVPKFATDRVVYCYDRYLAAIYRNFTISTTTRSLEVFRMYMAMGVPFTHIISSQIR